MPLNKETKPTKPKKYATGCIVLRGIGSKERNLTRPIIEYSRGIGF